MDTSNGDQVSRSPSNTIKAADAVNANDSVDTVGKTDAAGQAKLSAEALDMQQKLQLKDPAKLSTNDVLTQDYLNFDAIPSSSKMANPAAFAGVAAGLFKSDANHALNKGEIAAIIQSPDATADQKLVAGVMQQNFKSLSYDPSVSGLFKESSIKDYNFKNWDEQKDAADAFAKHPELKDPSTLANVLKSAYPSLSELNGGLHADMLRDGISGNKLNEQQKAASEFMLLNFKKFDELGGDGVYERGYFDRDDLDKLANFGKTQAQLAASEACPNQTNPVANAAKWGAGVAVVSKVGDSDQVGAKYGCGSDLSANCCDDQKSHRVQSRCQYAKTLIRMSYSNPGCPLYVILTLCGLP